VWGGSVWSLDGAFDHILDHTAHDDTTGAQRQISVSAERRQSRDADGCRLSTGVSSDEPCLERLARPRLWYAHKSHVRCGVLVLR